MSNKKRDKNKKNLLVLEMKREQILSELLDFDEILRGSLATVYTKCGKDNCWCKNGEGHPHSRISWSEKGEGYTRKVPKDEIPWVREVAKNYRKFRSLRRSLKQLETRIKKALDRFEDVLVDHTRKAKPYLWIKRQNRK